MSRRGENIYKRKDGRWEGRYIKSHDNGKIHYGYVYGKTYREVKQKIIGSSQNAVVSVMQSMPELPSGTFGATASEWLAVSRNQLKESSYVKYNTIVNNHLLPVFGGCQISDITRDDVSQLCNSLLSEENNKPALSPKTVSSIMCVLKSIFDYAAQVKQYATVDLRGVSIRQPQRQLRVLSLSEQQTLSAYLCENINLYHLGILICLYTGLRVGEICALRWGDVNFEEKAIYVRQTMQRLQCTESSGNKTQILISNPKSDSSVRRIPIPDELFNLIAQYRFPESSYFLTGTSKRYVEPRNMQNKFKKVLKDCGIENVNFHALRHTFATRCVELGFDIKSLSEILGHSSVNITLNRYVHPSMELKQQNMNKLSELLAVK